MRLSPINLPSVLVHTPAVRGFPVTLNRTVAQKSFSHLPVEFENEDAGAGRT